MSNLETLIGGVDTLGPHDPIGTGDVCLCGIPADNPIHTEMVEDMEGNYTFPSLTASRSTFRLLFAALHRGSVHIERVRIDTDSGVLIVDEFGCDVAAGHSESGQKLRAALNVFGTVRKRTDELLPGDRVKLPGNVVRTVETVKPVGVQSNAREELQVVIYTEGAADGWGYGNTANPSSLWEIV